MPAAFTTRPFLGFRPQVTSERLGRTRDDLVADRRSRTRTVFHDHLLRQCFRQFLREHASHYIRTAAGR